MSASPDKQGNPSRKRKRKRRSRQAKYTEGSALFNQRGLAVVATIATIGFLAFIVLTRESKVEQVEKQSELQTEEVESPSERMFSKYTPERILQLTRKLPGEYTELEFPLKAQELEARIETLESLRTKGLNEELHSEANRMLLRYYSLSDGLYLSVGLDRSKSKKRVTDFANQLLSDPDKETVNATKYVLMAIGVNELDVSISQEAYDNVERLLEMHGDGGLDNPTEAQSISQIVFSLARNHPDDPLADKTQLLFAEKLSAHSNPEIQEVGRAIMEHRAFGGVDIQALRDQLAQDIAGSDDKFFKVLQALDGYPNASIVSFAKLVAANESLMTVEKYESANNVANYLWEAKERVTDKRTSQFLETAVSRQKTRLALIGRKFDLAGLTIEGEEFPPVDDFTVIIFWSRLDRTAAKSIEDFVKAHPKNFNPGYRILGSCVEKFTPKLREDLERISSEVLFASEETAAKLLSQCPIDLMPYLVVVDPEQKVVALNVPISSLNSRMKQIMINAGRSIR